MAFVDALRTLKINIIDNNGVVNADYGVTSVETSRNKCFLLAVAEGIMNIYLHKYDRAKLHRALISFSEAAGVKENDMIDTSEHFELIQNIERHFGVQIHVRSAYNGSLAYINGDPIEDNKVLNVLCFTDIPGDVLYGHFVYVAFRGCLGGFIF